jgi:hypothetical protein
MGANESDGAGAMLTLFNRIWPLAVLTVGLVVTVAWMGLVGYGLMKLL